MDWKNIFGQCSLVLRLFLNAFRILFFALYHLKFSLCVFFFLHNVLTMNWIVFILHHRICLSQANEGFGAYLSRVRQLTLRTCCWKLICLSSTSVSANTEHKNLKVHLKGSSEGFIWRVHLKFIWRAIHFKKTIRERPWRNAALPNVTCLHDYLFNNYYIFARNIF